jgi:hypothetical protein
VRAHTLRAAERWRPLILQHLLLGINAHVNLDLGIAAVEGTPAGDLPDRRADFNHINRILGSMIEDVQSRLAAVSPWTSVLDRLGRRADEVISNFCLVRARDDAWDFAQQLAAAEPDRRDALVRAKDRETAGRTERILRPGSPQGNRINRQKCQPDAQTSIFWQRRTEKHSRLSFQT